VDRAVAADDSASLEETVKGLKLEGEDVSGDDVADANAQPGAPSAEPSGQPSGGRAARGV